MRVLYCNKYNYPFSGTEVHLFDLMQRMQSRGHETALFSMDHQRDSAFRGRSYLVPHIDFKSPDAGWTKKVRMAAHALYSPSSRRHMRRCLTEFAADVAHLRGIYNHLSPSILWELKHAGVPVIYHVNDFKLACPTYNFVAQGTACESCASGAYYHAVTKGCYEGGRRRVAVLAAEAYLHRWLKTYPRCVDLFLAPSQFARDKLIAAGVPADRCHLLPHFQALPPEHLLVPEKGYVLYFGRLSPEKGLDTLLRAMTQLPYVPLFIAGEGPDRQRLEALTRELGLTQVFFHGQLSGEKLERLISGCRFSVFPSHAYETFGKSILEAYAWGRPVIASDRGSRRELIEHGVTGVLYEASDSDQLAGAIGYLYNHAGLAAQLGAEGRRRTKERHDPEHYMDALLDIYSRVAARRRTPRPFATRTKAPNLSRPLRIAWIGGRGVISRYSGIESYYEHVGKELALRRHDLTVYCRTYFTPPVKEHNGMHILRLPTIRSKHLETFVHTLLSSLHALFADYDIVHYHCLGPALFSFIPRMTGRKTVVTVQGLDWQRRKWGRFAARVLRWGEAAAVRFPSTTMVASKTLQDYYRVRHNRETAYIPNGAGQITHRPPTRLIGWDLISEQYILFLGRFSPEKNCHLLIEAFEQLNTDMKLVLAGGTSHTDSYAGQLRAHASARVRFLDWVSGDDYDELLSNAAVFVLPSDLEGLSLALLDAMAAGVCVLTSDIPENREVVDGAGFTFRCGDRDDLTRMLQILVQNPLLRRKMAWKAKARIREEYQWSKIAVMIEQHYYDLLGWSRHEENGNAMAKEPAFPEAATGS